MIVVRAQEEGLVEIGGERFYMVPDVDRMAPFLMNVVSDGDRWMFVSSAGALTAGRGDVGGALFPYETDDRLHVAGGTVGPVTRMRLSTSSGEHIWRPFADVAGPSVHRTLAKSVVGDALLFEERHEGTELTFRYRWNTTDRDGFVRTASLVNHGSESVHVDLLDGLLGLLPHGLEPPVYQRLSNLSHAYKRSELIDPDTRLVVYSLESPVSDKAEPQEVLRATAVWSLGLDGASVTLDGGAVGAFDRGVDERAVGLLTGRPGAYLLDATVELAPGKAATWRIVADVALDQVDMVGLRHRLRTAAGDALWEEVDEAIGATDRQVVQIMALADAQQHTGDPVECAHHVANVTYNVLRGGVPLAGYQVDTADFAEFVTGRNRLVAERHSAWLAELALVIDRQALLAGIAALDDVHLTRLGREYLPFSFSRRHGDPSRPWNAFSIRVRDDAGKPIIHYEGNWRDVFQNWEALCASFPEYLPGIVTLFVDASTADGHNPYRISRDGIDWEVPDPDDPWANIGYWGDHQIVYLLRLLLAADRYMPGEVAGLLDERCCTFADVPYRISDFEAMMHDSKTTIHFDTEADARAQARVEAMGGDGKLLPGDDGQPFVVTLLEKLLIAALAKLCNFVPGGGIWMNTQRPEWNDANNALVGHGLSMVTACHLRAYLDHLRALVGAGSADAVVTTEVATWLERVTTILSEEPVDVDDAERDRRRLAVMERLGRVAAAHRHAVYEAGFSGATTVVPRQSIVEACGVAIGHLDATIRTGLRVDGLVHAYNLIDFRPGGAGAAVRHLPEMLEGQVAALGSGVLTSDEQADLLDSLFESALYRPDQDTFLLAPVRHLPAFVDKNVISPAEVDANGLLSALAAKGDTSVVRQDADGHHRFHRDLTDEGALAAALDRLGADAEWSTLVDRHRRATFDTYERVFNHHAYLGRSGSMYAYEGIGSVYWHMVSKLLLAVQEAVTAAADGGASAATLARLVNAYWRVRGGLGVNKSAAAFGAIPTDPYSHTPAHAGAQQPGMTGAVKEELLARPLELGVRIVDGQLTFDSRLVRQSELHDRPASWAILTVDGHDLQVEIPAGALGLTVCQVPVVVEVGGGEPFIDVRLTDGRSMRLPGHRLGRELSSSLFRRMKEVESIHAVV